MVKRKNNWKVCCIGITTCFSFYTQASFCQRIQTFTDKKDILIGEQIQYKVKASFPRGVFKVHWFTIPDSIPHFEVIEQGRIDSSAENTNTVFLQTITLTSFDSGQWSIPSFAVNFDPVKDDTTINLFTDPVPVNVTYSPPDSTNELRDIKPVIKVTVTDYSWYYIIGGILLFLLSGFLFYRYWKKKKKVTPPLYISKLSAYDEAMLEIGKLAQHDLQNAGDVKLYHSTLSVIFKRYLGRKQNKNLLNKTTGDLLIRIADSSMAAGRISNLATALRCTDAVKFARYLPEVTESEDCKLKIKETIDLIEHQAITNKP